METRWENISNLDIRPIFMIKLKNIKVVFLTLSTITSNRPQFTSLS